MKIKEAIDELEKMEHEHGSGFFGEVAALLREAKSLIENFGTTGADSAETYDRARKFLEDL